MQKVSVLIWLSPLQMTQVHQTVSDRAEKGFGEWFLNSAVFLSWMAAIDNLSGAGEFLEQEKRCWRRSL